MPTSFSREISVNFGITIGFGGFSSVRACKDKGIVIRIPESYYELILNYR